MIQLIRFGCTIWAVGLVGSLILAPARAEQQPHEYAEIKPLMATLTDFRLKTVLGDREVSLKEFIRGRRLVLVSFIAPWCDNSMYDAPLVAKLYEKYADRGFDVLTVSNYAPAEDLLKFVERFNFVHTVVLDTTDKDETHRLHSRHYQFRQSLNDSRKWGTPLNVFIVDGRLDKLYVAAGELIESNATPFIETHLAPATAAK